MIRTHHVPAQRCDETSGRNGAQAEVEADERRDLAGGGIPQGLPGAVALEERWCPVGGHAKGSASLGDHLGSSFNNHVWG